MFVPSDTSNITMLVPEFVTTGKEVAIGAGIQKSGETIVDFSSEKTYTVTSLDGLSSQDYTVKVIKNPAPPIVVPHDKALEVSWDTVSNATGYEVWYYAGNTPSAAVRSGGDYAGTSASITGLSNGTTYYVWIKAIFAGNIRSGLSLASASATANVKTFGWLYTGFNDGSRRGVGKYAVSLTDGSLSGTDTLVSSDLAPSGSEGVRAMAVDKAHGFLFYAYRSSSSTSSDFMVRSAKVDPPTGNLVENAAVTTDDEFCSLVVSKDGRHLYGDSGGMFKGGRVYCWDIDPDNGSLTNKQTVETGGWSMGMAIHPTLNLLYVPMFSSSSPEIRIYDLDPITGAPSYRKSLVTPTYPQKVACSPDGSRLLVSYSQESPQTHSIEAYKLDGLGLPSPTTCEWYDALGTTSGMWQIQACAPVPDSPGECTVLANDLNGLNAIKSFSKAHAVNVVLSAGSRLTDGDYLTLPSPGNAVHIYASRISAGIASYKVTTTPGLLEPRVDTGKGPGTYVVKALILPW